MSTYLAVQHPIDPSTPDFDFWGWRLQRRFVVDRLLALAPREPGTQSEMLSAAATALQTETLDAALLRGLTEYLAVTDPRSVTTLRDLLMALSDRTRTVGVSIRTHWKLPVIRPDWDRIPFQRPAFVGAVDGVSMRARLVPSSKVVPEYTLIWQSPDGHTETAIDIASAKIGPYLDYAPALWDWLVARRLTMLCLGGLGPWPEPTKSPLLLNGAWSNPPYLF
jgi:hypothetical protein